MKDFISKITFGFFMAQLVPGMMVIMTVTSMNESSNLESRPCIEAILKAIERWWSPSGFRITAFLFLSCAVGMLIHALNWMVLAWVENQNGLPVRETRHHTRSLWVQLITGPVAMIIEVLSLLWAPNLTHLTMEENVKSLKQDSQWQFQFLQDFWRAPILCTSCYESRG